ncbi:MAG: hypothetical protein KKB30_01155, partial [Proteobacteria bacterium]|nr:hypothetical protein [Pseudomonadota bacterium]MBU1714222.1 hypothetical protein [Pseudomonadota bacterium]
MKLKVRNKLIIGFMPLLIVIFLFSLAGIKTFIAIHQNISDLQQKITPTAMSMLELKSVLLSLETEIKARDIDQKKTEEQIGQIQNLLRNHLATEDSSDDPNKQIAQDIRLRAMRVMKYARYLRNTTKKSWMEPAEVDKIMNNIYQERIALSNILDEHIAL